MQERTAKSRRATRPSNPSSRLANFKQLEIEYGPPYRSWYDLAARGLLPVVRFPGSRRLWADRRDVEALIASSREHRA
jgi:hypothetical protein